LEIALRCYTDTKNDKKQNYEKDNYSRSLILVLDTETTSDEYQNLKFGSCCIYRKVEKNRSILVKIILFYNEDLMENEIKALRDYADKHQYDLMSRNDFIEQVLFFKAYNDRVPIVGFNLPFDLSRLAIHYGESIDKIREQDNKTPLKISNEKSKAKTRKPNNGISLKLSSKPWYPNITIKTLDSKRAFISFTTPYIKESKKKKGRKAYKGCFIDLRTFLFALTNESYNLKRALEDFQCRPKIDVETHGNITEEYIDYNINDTLATYELYEKALERYSLFCLDIEPNKLFSPASIGKNILDKIRLRSFDEKNPEFPKEKKGI
jgi:hypothetical protein